MDTKKALSKFGGGALSGGVVALIAFLADRCGIDDWTTFVSAAILAILSGAFHVVKNIKKDDPL